MKYIRFGRTNVQVPAVSLGTWGHGGPRVSGGASVGWSGNDDDLAREALVASYDAGITHWDTADVYGDGHAEELIGSVWDRVPREKIFLASKVGYDTGGYDHFYDPRMMREHLERSLRLLKTDVLDLHYFHHCDFGPNGEYFDAALATMRRFRDEGKIRFIGLSDWELGRIMQYVERVDPDVVQPYRNVVDDAYESSGLKAWVDAHDAGVAFFSPLKHGLLLGKYTKPATFAEGDYRRNVPEFGDAAYIEKMQRVKSELERHFSGREEPVLHAVVGVLLTGNPSACVLLGQRNRKQVDAASRVGEPLSDRDAQYVRQLFNS